MQAINPLLLSCSQRMHGSDGVGSTELLAMKCLDTLVELVCLATSSSKRSCFVSFSSVAAFTKLLKVLMEIGKQEEGPSCNTVATEITHFGRTKPLLRNLCTVKERYRCTENTHGKGQRRLLGRTQEQSYLLSVPQDGPYPGRVDCELLLHPAPNPPSNPHTLQPSR